jgi:hypothetical protein
MYVVYYFVEALSIGHFFRDLNCLTNMLVHQFPKRNIVNGAINDHISYGGCPLLLLYTNDAMSGSFLGFKCFSGVLNSLNSKTVC